MHLAQFDSASNLLKLSFAGQVGADEAKKCAQEIEALLRQARPGFRLLTDLSGLEAMDLACVPYLEQTMDRCSEQGIDTVVRVIPDPQKDIGFNILSLFHYNRRVRIVTCETMQEALNSLAPATTS